MSKRKKYIEIGWGELCPKCDKKMIRRKHEDILEKQRNAPYYFSEWDHCRECKHLQHYEQFKVFNLNKSAELYKQKVEKGQVFLDLERLVEKD